MQVVIMAGGKGERLGDIVNDKPKALLSLGDICLFDSIISGLHFHGASEIIVCTGHLGEQFENRYKNSKLNLKFFKEEFPLGTAGALGNISDFLEEDFLVVNSDIFTDFSFSDFFNSHKETAHAATVGITYINHQLKYGKVEFSENGEIINLEEKPSWSYPVLIGVYAFKKSLIQKFCSINTHLDMTDLLKLIIQSEGSIGHYAHAGQWIDIGTPEDYKRVLGISDANP